MRTFRAARSTLILTLAASCRAGSADQISIAHTNRAPASPTTELTSVVPSDSGPRIGDPCIGEGVSDTCTDSVERVALAALPGWSRPTPGERVYRTVGDGELRLRDDSTQGESYVAHRLLGQIQGTRYAVVTRSRWEYHDYLLVGETGDTTAIEGWPIVAPDGQRVAVASLDLDACYQSNRLEIWRIASPTPVREFTQETGDCAEGRGWGPSNLVWTDSLTLSFAVHQAAGSSTDAGPGRGTLSRKSSGWKLVFAR